MEPKVKAAKQDIVFAVTRILFGDRDATIDILQRLVACALEHHGITKILEGLTPEADNGSK